MTDVPSSKILTEEEASLRDLRSEASYLEKYGFHYPDENYVFRSRPGLDAQIVAEISHIKGEPAWMLELRLKALKEFERRPMPTWGGDLSGIKFDEIYYYVRATEKGTADWSEVPDDIKETFDRLGIPEAERQFLAGAGAQYECLAAGTKVYTSRGAVPIEEIREGDIVFAYDEQAEKLIPAPVKATMAKGKRQVYEVKVGTRTIRATDNHPFLTLSYERQEGKRRGHYQRTWKYLHEIKAGDLVAVAKALPEVGESHTLELPVIKQEDKYRYNEVNLPEETSEDLMWLLGLYMGDGYVHRQKRKAQVAFAIPESDPQLQAEVKEATKRLFGLEARRGDAFRLIIGSTIVADYFEMNGFEGNSHTKRVPHWVYSLPLNQRLAFLGGYLDSDGYVRDHAKNHDVMYTSANAALLEDVRQLTLSCSLPASNIHHFASPHVHDKTRMVDGYRLLVSGDTQKIPARSERRRERLGKKKYTHNYSSAGNTCFRVHTNKYLGYVRVTSITPVGEAEVYDIEVDGPHNFVAEGLIVHNSEMVYHKVQEHLEKQGVIFLSMDDGLRQHPELVKEYFGSIIPYTDNKFAALNTAVWSGGSFIYVPKGVHVEMPLQAYFRINTESMGQFERTLIIVDEGGHIHYVEGCTAPVYSKNSLHSAVVEIIVKKGGKCRYTTIQNWSNNVYNLVTKRAVAYADATMEWVDANLGCLCKESTITTPQGIKTIENVEVGDQVLSYDEKEGKLVFRKVMAKRYSGEQPVHTISVGERKLRATANHPFYSYTYNPDAPRKSGRYQLSYVRADQLQQVILPRTSVDYGVPYRLIKPVLTTTFESFNQYASNLTMTRTQAGRLTDVEYTTDDIMWMFGYWMGDGNIQVKEGKTEGVTRWAKVGFSTPRTDRARPQLMKVMGEIIEAEPTERADGVHLAWNSKELAEFFRLNGFYGKAADKRVPEWVWSLPESQRLAFIAGYLDADGTMQANQFCAKSVNKALLEDMASLLVTLGITPRLHTEFSEPKTVMIMGYECVAHGSHRLVFRVDERFFPYLSSSLRERAAQSTAQKQLVLGRHIGRSSIELGDDVEVATVKVSEASAEPVPTWDIEVEGTGNFVSEGFIVHNSHLTMKYPAVHMMEPGAHGEILSIAFAGKGQHQDAGGKVVHHAPNTTSRIISKSISKDGGRASYRGLLKVDKNATGVRSNVVCDALLLDPASRSDTYPYIEVDEQDVTIGHEASVSKIGEEQLFYLMSRGLSEDQANAMIVNGFIEPLAKELPMEYSMELRKLIDIQLEGTIG